MVGCDGLRAVFGVGVGDVQGAMRARVRVVGVDPVVAFWSAVVSLLLLAAGGPSERDLVDVDGCAVREERHCVGGFDDNDVVGKNGGRRRCRRAGRVANEAEHDRELQRDDDGGVAEGWDRHALRWTPANADKFRVTRKGLYAGGGGGE